MISVEIDSDKKIADRRNVLGEKYCPTLFFKKFNLAPIMMLLKKRDYSPGALISALLFPQLRSELLGSYMESRVADDCNAIKCVFHSLSPLLSFGRTEWERRHFIVAL